MENLNTIRPPQGSQRNHRGYSYLDILIDIRASLAQEYEIPYESHNTEEVYSLFGPLSPLPVEFVACSISEYYKAYYSRIPDETHLQVPLLDHRRPPLSWRVYSARLAERSRL